MVSRLGMYARFVGGMHGFLRQRITPDSARAIIARRIESREKNFLQLLEGGVFNRPESPYSFLLREAGCEPGDVRRMLNLNGVDATLASLYDAGVRISFNEFKGRSPITRNGRTFESKAESFDNPLVAGQYESESSGSTGRATSIRAGLAHIAAQAPMMLLAQEANGTLGAPTVLYRPGYPCNTATNNILRHIIIGNPVRRWFSPVSVADSRAALRFRVASVLTPPLVRLYGEPFPEMEVVPFSDAAVVASAAASFVRSEGACLLRCSVSAALTVAIAATERGIDLKGVVFNGTGEPASRGKVSGIVASGARYVTSYSMTESGPIGVACARGSDSTDVHVMRDKVALLQRMQTPAGAGDPVGVFYLSTLLSSAPKIMINVSTDDFGILEDRKCGCLAGELGMHQHLRQIRSIAKLTGRGITLVASDIVHIIEEVLPRRFGGSAQDYQLVEEEDSSGRTHLHLLVSPKVELTDEEAPARVLLEELSRGTPGASLQSAMLRSAHAVHVRRQQPGANARGKLPAFKTVAAQ
jgi:hypothetical protein